ncbi:NAD(P)-binding protein, partial [Paraphaeosphaeria sporulosa]
LAVFGATGHQGGAIVSHFLSLPNPPYTIRALTRSPTSQKARRLADAGVDVVHADLDHVDSLKRSMQGAEAVFLVTDFFSCPDPGAEHEVAQAKRVLDILAASRTLKHLVYSSLPSISAASSGRYRSVVHFDGKASVVDWLQQTHEELWGKTTVLWVGTYMQLWMQFPHVFAPRKVVNGGGEEIWQWNTVFYPHTKLPLVDVKDVGVAARTILEGGEECMGQTLSLVAPELVTAEEQLRVWGEVVGKDVVFRHVSEEE